MGKHTAKESCDVAEIISLTENGRFIGSVLWHDGFDDKIGLKENESASDFERELERNGWVCIKSVCTQPPFAISYHGNAYMGKIEYVMSVI